MYKIGITGSIGTGKTTIANIFAFFKIPIFDADKEIKEILHTKKVKKEIGNIWPQVLKNNTIDKLKLRSIIFNNKSEKLRLEKLLYPHLQIQKCKFDNTNFQHKVLVYDIPLIYETKSHTDYNLILLTNCDAELQKKRVINRDKISSSLFNKINQSQLSFDEKIKFKPKIINTNNLKLVIFVIIFFLLVKILIELNIKNGKRKKINS